MLNIILLITEQHCTGSLELQLWTSSLHSPSVLHGTYATE